MNDFELEQQNEVQEDSEIEITDLEMPGDASINLPPLLASRCLEWQRTLNRERVRFATALGIVSLLLLLLLLNLDLSISRPVSPGRAITGQYVKQSPPVTITPSVVIMPHKDGLNCVNDAVWSPESNYIAFLGYQKQCAGPGHIYERGLLAVHDAISGNLIKRLSPDNAILQTVSRQFPQIHTSLVIYYRSVLWSPDDRNLALTFSIGLSSPAEAGIDGVMLVRNDSGDVQVLLHLRKDANSPVEWDLQRHEALNGPAFPVLHPYISAGTAIPPVFAYRWGTNGALLPLVLAGHLLLIPRSRLGDSQLGRVGNPDGGRAFTIWQPGTSTLATQVHNGTTIVPGIYTWKTNFVVWSPDGRFLVDSFSLQRRLQLPDQPAPDGPTVANLHVDHLPVLTVRDVALQHLLMTLGTSSSNVMVSWHPGGFILAAYDSQTVDLDLYDCVTGYEIASLRLPSPFANPILTGSSVLRWSPDGSRLFLFDPQLGMAMIWQIPA